MFAWLKLPKVSLALFTALLIVGCGGGDSPSSELLPSKGDKIENSDSIDLVISEQRLQPVIKLDPIVAINEQPSHVTALFKVVDDDLEPVSGLAEKYSDSWQEHFSVAYDDGLMDVESYTYIEPATNLQLPTVIAIDISSSISDQDFVTSVTAVRDALIDLSGAEPTSKLLDNQLVSIIVFDADVSFAPPTRNADDIAGTFAELLSDGYRNLRASSNSTDLYSAASLGLELSLNSLSLSETPLGTLIIISDGNENANVKSLDEVIEQRDSTSQRVYTVTSQTEHKEWFDLASEPDNEIEVTDLEEVTSVIQQIFDEINTNLDGYYLLKHSTASQSGDQKLVLQYQDAVGNSYQMDYEYPTGSFSGSNVRIEIAHQPQIIVESDFEPFSFPLVAYRYFNVLEPNLQLDWYLNDALEQSDADQISTLITDAGLYQVEVVAERSLADDSDDIMAMSWFSVAPYEVSLLRYADTQSWNLQLMSGTEVVDYVWQASPYSENGQPIMDGANPKLCEYDPDSLLDVNCECTFSIVDGSLLFSLSGDDTAYCSLTAIETGTDAYLGGTFAANAPVNMEFVLTAYFTHSALDDVIDFEAGSIDPHAFSQQWQAVNSESQWHQNMGSYVLKSNPISHGETTSIEFAAQFSSLSFDFLTRSEEGYDFLEVLIDGEKVFWYSGDMNKWRTTDTISVPFSLHSVEVRYRKDATISDSSDAVYIDNIVYM